MKLSLGDKLHNVDFTDWVSQNFITVLNALGVVGGLFFTGYAAIQESKSRRISNLITLTQNHRELWSLIYSRPGLSRVLDAGADLQKKPVTSEEALFVNLLVIHINAYFQAMNAGHCVKPQQLHKDLQWLFSLPIPGSVWAKIKTLQDDDFVAFIDEHLGPPIIWTK